MYNCIYFVSWKITLNEWFACKDGKRTSNKDGYCARQREMKWNSDRQGGEIERKRNQNLNHNQY